MTEDAGAALTGTQAVPLPAAPAVRPGGAVGSARGLPRLLARSPYGQADTARHPGPGWSPCPC